MEKDAGDAYQLESNVLLPPRKRLLAGLKKQNSNGNGAPSLPPTAASSSHPSNDSANVQRHHDDSNLTPDEIAKLRSTAEAAALAANAVRAAADEKVMAAEKAIAAAKNALELLNSFPEEVKDRSKNSKEKKKHVPVEILHSNTKGSSAPDVGDEDLEQRLHRAIKNSPLFSRNWYRSDGRFHNSKRCKIMLGPENPRSKGVLGSNSDSSTETEDKTKAKEQDTMEAVEDKTGEENTLSGKRSGRVKIKVSLSNFHSKDEENQKEGGVIQSSQKMVECKRNKEKSLVESECLNEGEGVAPMVSGGPSWKCLGLKASECAKQTKAVRS